MDNCTVFFRQGISNLCAWTLCGQVVKRAFCISRLLVAVFMGSGVLCGDYSEQINVENRRIVVGDEAQIH